MRNFVGEPERPKAISSMHCLQTNFICIALAYIDATFHEPRLIILVLGIQSESAIRMTAGGQESRAAVWV